MDINKQLQNLQRDNACLQRQLKMVNDALKNKNENLLNDENAKRMATEIESLKAKNDLNDGIAKRMAAEIQSLKAKNDVLVEENKKMKEQLEERQPVTLAEDPLGKLLYIVFNFSHKLFQFELFNLQNWTSVTLKMMNK